VTGQAAGSPARLRLLVAVGRQQERRILDACAQDRTLRVVGRCTSALELVPRLEQDGADVVLLDDDLHLLSADQLQDLVRRRRVPTVLLVHDPEAERWRTLRAVILPWTAEFSGIRSGLDRAVRRDFARPRAGTERGAPRQPAGAATRPPEAATTRRGRVVALFGGAGGPGRTTLAVNLLAILGASRRAVLVDLDTTAAAVAAHLRAVQPAWNLLDVALADPRAPEAWDHIFADWLQPIGGSSPGARVLSGIGRPRERSALSGTFVETLIAQLAERFDDVLLDLGDEPLSDASTAALVGAAALRAADVVLLVAVPDVLGVHRARIARDEAASVLDLERTGLVLNRCGRGEDGAWCAATLRLPLLARIPFDPRVERALADGQPAVCDPGSRLRRPLGELAERLTGEGVALPTLGTTQPPPHRTGWLRPLLGPVASLLGGSR